MVLSLAVILALIGAAIGFILGFVIFSEISETVEAQVLKDFPQGCCPPPPIPQPDSIATTGNVQGSGFARMSGNEVAHIHTFTGLTVGGEVKQAKMFVQGLFGSPPKIFSLAIYDDTRTTVLATSTTGSATGAGQFTVTFSPTAVIPSNGNIAVMVRGEAIEFWKTTTAGVCLDQSVTSGFNSPFQCDTVQTRGDFDVELTISEPDIIPPFTDQDQERAETVQFAKSTGFTVLAILPISLFFIIFTVVGNFTGRT